MAVSFRRYRVRHTTSYNYEVTASLAYNIVAARPRDCEFQKVSHYRAMVDPEVQAFWDFRDYFGNSFRYFSIEHEFQGLSVTCLADVEVLQRQLSSRTLNVSLSECQEWTNSLWQKPHPLFRESQFVFPSALVQWNSLVQQYAQQCVHKCATALEAVSTINSKIHQDFSYRPGSTHLTSSVAEVFAQKQGVCQDFAHLGVAICRSLGLASRYVSGYLLTVPPPGQPKLVGADASHAWFSVLLPSNQAPSDNDGGGRKSETHSQNPSDFDSSRGAGVWVDFDPTNNCRVAFDHICQAWGRDYSDVSPVRGVVMGGGLQHVNVAVDVLPSES